MKIVSNSTKLRLKHNFVRALKTGIGGCMSYYIAESLHLEFASSAGIITLLTLQQTKWETLKLSYRRVFTFFMTYLTCMLFFNIIPAPWLDYGIYLFILVFLCESLGWRTAVSANAVTAAHLISEQNFSHEMMLNELLIVLIGISMAIIFNLFHINETHEAHLIENMRDVEKRMSGLLKDLAGYLRHQYIGREIWRDVEALQEDLAQYTNEAQEYQNNTFFSHPEYYINYFNMRKIQSHVLYNLHAEMQRLRDLPIQAEVVADFMYYISENVSEKADPQEQKERLEALLQDMKISALPETREEFESRAMLYHVLMDLEDWMMVKDKFIAELDEEQYEIYWKNEKKNKRVKEKKK